MTFRALRHLSSNTVTTAAAICRLYMALSCRRALRFRRAMATIQIFQFSRATLLAALLCTGVMGSPPPADADIAIVVRPDLPVDNISFADLRRLMLGDRQYWSSNLRVTLLVRAPGTHER